jgi:hypothetical protein
MTAATRKIIRTAIEHASASSLVLDFGPRPGTAWALTQRLRDAGVSVHWDGAILTIPLADVEAAGMLRMEQGEPVFVSRAGDVICVSAPVKR